MWQLVREEINLKRWYKATDWAMLSQQTLIRWEAPKRNRLGLGLQALMRVPLSERPSWAEESSCLRSGDGVCRTGSWKHSCITDAPSISPGSPHYQGVFVRSLAGALLSVGIFYVILLYLIIYAQQFPRFAWHIVPASLPFPSSYNTGKRHQYLG